MENYIISPWLFYFIDFMPRLTIIFFAIGSIFLAIGGYIFYICQEKNYPSKIYWEKECINLEKVKSLEKEYAKKKKQIIVFGIFTLFFYLLAALVPTPNTCYEMLIAHFATYENVDYIGEQIKNITDYVFDRMEEINN